MPDDPTFTKSPDPDPGQTGSPGGPGQTDSLLGPVATIINGGGTSTFTQPLLASAGRYVLGDEIARGGMGVVYRATDTVFGREVAVKVLQNRFAPNSGAVTRFLDEAKITGQLQHPAIPPAHDLGTLPDGRLFLAMKLIRGQTLETWLSDRADPSADRGRFVAAFEHVCQAVAYAHAHKVIHRDLKPANIMVGNYGEVQVMDWGLAKLLSVEVRIAAGADPDETTAATEIHSLRESDSSFTQAGSILGTPAFMPPEQAAGAVRKIDARSDVFGLGAVLAVILTGKPPFEAASAETTRIHAAQGKVEECFARLDSCGADPGLVELCKRCLSPSQSDRPGDAGAVAKAVADLRAAADERARRAELDRVKVEGEKVAAEMQATEQRKRRRVQLLLGAAVVVLLLGVAAAAWWRADQARVANERLGRNAEAVASLLDQCEGALKAGDASKAGIALEAAQKRAAEGGAESLTNRIEGLRDDLVALTGLDAVDQFRWAPLEVENKLPGWEAVTPRYHAALARFGADPTTIPAEVAAARISASSVRDRLVAALDRLLREERSPVVRKTLQAVDSDPYRNAIRDAILAQDTPRIVALATQAEALDQPPGFTAFLGESEAIGVIRRRELLAAAIQQQPGELGLLMTLSNNHPIHDWERLRWLQAAIAVAPANTTALINLGLTLRYSGDRDAAMACFKKVIRLTPNDPWGHANLGIIRFSLKDYPEAIACYRTTIRLDPTSAKFRFEFGTILEANGDLEDAITQYREAIRLDAKLATAHSSLGLVLLSQGDRIGAEAACREAIALDPKLATSHNNFGVVLHAKGDLIGEEAEYREAIKLDPRHALARSNLGGRLLGKGDMVGAEVELQLAIKFDPKLPAPYYSMGCILRNKGNLLGAEAAFRQAIKVDPKYALAHNGLGLVLLDQGKPTEAVAKHREAIALDPKLATWHNDLGNALHTKGDLIGAEAEYREAIKISPTFAFFHNNLGNILRGKGEFVEAEAEYREAIKLDPKYAGAHNGLGNILRDKGDLVGAEAAFRHAIAHDPGFALAWDNLGVVLRDKGDLAGAEAKVRQAIQLDPNHGLPRNSLGLILHDKWQLNESMAEFRRSIQLNPTDAWPHHNLGNLLRETGDWVGAEAQYRQAIALNPNHASFHNSLSLFLQDKGDLLGAEAECRQAITIHPERAAFHNNLGVLLELQGRLEDAIVEYQKVIFLDPKNAFAMTRLKEVKRMRELLTRLPDILHGTAKPTTLAEACEFANLCTHPFQTQYTAAVHLFEGVFAADPSFATDLQYGYRYNAACFAARAARGDEVDAPAKSSERLAIRVKALGWLRADLTHWKPLAMSANAAYRKAAAVRFSHWLHDLDLSRVRHPFFLAALPADEAKQWQALWNEVRATRDEALKPPPPREVAPAPRAKG